MKQRLKIIFYLLLLIGLSLILVGCNMEDGKGDPKKTEFTETSESSRPTGWEEGKFYHDRGKDTTIQGELYFEYKFNKKTEVYDTTWYQAESYRFW